MNQSYGSKTYTPALKVAIDHIRQSHTSLVISTGDMVAGQKHGLDYLGMWNAFHNEVTRPLGLAGLPLLPSPGNHDASQSAGYTNERRYYQNTFNAFAVDRFNGERQPEDQVQFLPNVAQNYPFNYAVTMGPALFIGLDANVAGALSPTQFAWLENVLKSSSAFKVKIIFGHMPLLPFTFDRATDYLGFGNTAFGIKLESLLEQYQVNYFLSGHHHGYFPGQRNGRVKYVSVPLLGTGARYLMTADRHEIQRAYQAFLYLEFDEAGNIQMQALKSPDMTEITSAMLPNEISIPEKDASDCRSCSRFPSIYFLDSKRRSIYERF